MTWLTDWLALIIYSAAASFKALLNGAVVIMMMWRGHWCFLIYKNTSIVCRVVSKPYRLWNTIIQLYIYKYTVAAVSFVSTTIKPLLYVAFFLNSTLRFFSIYSLPWSFITFFMSDGKRLCTISRSSRFEFCRCSSSWPDWLSAEHLIKYLIL